MVLLNGTEEPRRVAREAAREVDISLRREFIRSNEGKTIPEIIAAAAALGVTVEYDQAGILAEEARIKAELTAVIQKALDDKAVSYGYDSILSLCSYATSSDASFKAQGEAGMVWRDQVWVYARQVFLDVTAETRAVPTAEELLAELPESNIPT